MTDPNPLDELAALQGPPERDQAAAQLTAILGLEAVGIRVTSARVVGRGGGASVDIHLSDSSVVEFERLRDVSNPKLLAAEIAAVAGATPTIRPPQALRAIALIRALAEHTLTASTDDLARVWGLDFLQAVSHNPVDLVDGDQASRWAAFCALRDCKVETRPPGAPIVDYARIVRVSSQAGELEAYWVRTGWFREHIRRDLGELDASPERILNRMQRVGWIAPNSQARIKATDPTSNGSLSWSFYIVPASWAASSAVES